MARPTNRSKVSEALAKLIVEDAGSERPALIGSLTEATGLDAAKVLDELNAIVTAEPAVDLGDNALVVAGARHELQPLREGYGYIVLDAPAELVAAFARLHIADRHTMSMQAAGSLREMLWQLGRMRRPIDELIDGEPVDVAIVAGPTDTLAEDAEVPA